MSRSGYGADDDYEYDPLELGRWRGQVASAIRSKRGQTFLRELRDALDAMPDKRLIKDQLRSGTDVCAIGSLGAVRGIDLEALNPKDPDAIASAFGIAHQLVREIAYWNDEGNWSGRDSPQSRWCRMRAWVSENIREPKT